VTAFLGAEVLIDAAAFAGLGFWLYRTHSRAAATLLVGLSALGVGMTAMAPFGGRVGGRNVVLAVVVFWAALRAALAAYKPPGLLQPLQAAPRLTNHSK
jgi:hypothetical protein